MTDLSIQGYTAEKKIVWFVYRLVRGMVCLHEDKGMYLTT